MRLFFYLIVASVTACSAAPGPTVLRDLGPLPSMDRVPPGDAGGLQQAALSHFSGGDYVRALRYAYWASQTIPTDIRLRLLLGVIYDEGFSRPDLALPEYRRAHGLSTLPELTARLDERIRYLHRRELEDRYLRAALAESDPPLSKNGLAVFPLQVVGPRTPEPGLTHGLLTLMLPSLRDRSTALHIDPFAAPIAAQVYGEVRGNNPEDFARWSGAGAVLTGTLADLGGRRVRVVLRRLDSTGSVVWTSEPIVGRLDAAGDLCQSLLASAGRGLGIDVASGGASISSPLALSLYAEGVLDYAGARVLEAHRNLKTALSFEPGSAILNETYVWVDQDLNGSAYDISLAEAYRDLLKLPDASNALQRRLSRAHTLARPQSPTSVGKESIAPYKRPRAEVAP
ncbi:MAG: hypothetical protein CME26_07100 [Gemmatimonadetes bacterium]|nr:hypothetical protein [Gemmatimonadota bacterium]|tara:strand:- start:6477 stop:7673 length:1197 start_codon:yes stop_codon:yes gene_type:complete